MIHIGKYNYYINIFLFSRWRKYRHYIPIKTECYEIGPLLIFKEKR
jgi:hypothetical protein